MSKWTLFSNHGHVLLYLAGDPESRLRDVSVAVGITERAVQKIVRDLQDAGILTVSKQGRRNRYRVNTRKPLRHQLESHRTVGELVDLINAGKAKPRRKIVEPAPVTRPKSAESERPVVPASGPLASPAELPREQPSPGTEPAPAPLPAPASEQLPEPVPAPVPLPEPRAEQVRERKPTSPTAKPDKPKKKRKRTPPADEQQGSLF